MRPFPILLALALPTVAQAEPGTTLPAYTGTLEFNIGFGGTATLEPEKGETLESDLVSTFGITPGIDKMLGRSVGVGLEFGFLWFGTDEDGDESRQLVLNPSARIRMAFPIVPKVTFDGLLGVGAAFWTADDDAPSDTPMDSMRVGWSLRFNFGGSYQFNESVAAFGNIGYYTTTSFGDDLTAEYSMVPLNIGLRGAF